MVCSSYKWQREEWEYPLDENETIIDWSYITESNFTLAVLLTSQGGIRIYSKIGSDGPKKYVTNLQKLDLTINEAAAVCFLPDASGLAFILPKGNILLVPLRHFLDVPWGRWTNDSISIITVDGVEEGCLCRPTSALCYNALYSKRSFLIYANKAGQLFIIDLTVVAVSVMLRAPESIHQIALYANKSGAHLLVNGFTGQQWILPLETGGRGLRETLSQVIPWEIKEQLFATSRVSVAHDGTLAVLNISDCVVKFYDTPDFKIAKHWVSVPKNTWLIHAASNVIFAVADSDAYTGSSVYFSGLFDVTSAFCEKVDDFLGAKIMGFIPIICEDILPTCLIVMEQDVIALSPNKSSNEILVDFVAKFDYNHDMCKLVAEKFGMDTVELIQHVFKHTLPNLRNSKDRSVIMNKLIQLALHSSLALVTLIKWCTDNDSEEALVEVVKEVCGQDPNEEARHYMINLCMARYKARPQERDKIEIILNEFLVQHPDVHTGMEQLFVANFWTSIAIIVDNISDEVGTVGNYLAKTENDWPVVHIPFIVKILASQCWELFSEDVGEMLVRRMAKFLPNLRSMPHITVFVKIATELLTSYPRAAPVLYVLSSLRLISLTQSNYVVSRANVVISSGSNCISVVTSEETVGYWGNFSPGTLKDKSCSTLGVHGVSRLCFLDVPVRVCSISCGTEHLLCLTIHGKVYAFGRNRFGQCGIGNANELTKATEVVGDYGFASAICAGHYHSALINEQGYAFTWGWSFHGQLGHNGFCSFDDVFVPHLVKTLIGKVISVACGYAHTLFLMESGVVYSCGNGMFGQLGNGFEVKKRFIPEITPIPDKVTMIASKFFHCLAVTETQKIYCWGISPQALKMKMFVKRRLRGEANKSSVIEKKNEKLAISQAHLGVSEVEHMLSSKIIHIDAGYSHSALINEDNNLFTWGKSLDMQLGHGNKKEQDEPHQLSIPANTVWNFVSCGYDFTTAVTAGGAVYVWGRNHKGHLGVETGAHQPIPRKIVFKTAKGPSRTVEMAGDTSCLPRPTKFPFVIAYTSPEICFDEVRTIQFIDFVKKLDLATICDISSQLLQNPIYCRPALYIHLLAGDLANAAKFLVHLPSTKTIIDKHSLSEGTLSLLIEIVWDLMCKHSDFLTQSKVVSNLLCNFAVSDLIITTRKLSVFVPLILISKPELLPFLYAFELLKILETWQPDSCAYGLQLLQDSVQDFTGKVRYCTYCGSIEKCTGSVWSAGSNGRRQVCSRCREKWSSAVRARLFKYDCVA